MIVALHWTGYRLELGVFFTFHLLKIPLVPDMCLRLAALQMRQGLRRCRKPWMLNLSDQVIGMTDKVNILKFAIEYFRRSCECWEPCLLLQLALSLLLRLRIVGLWSPHISSSFPSISDLPK